MGLATRSYYFKFYSKPAAERVVWPKMRGAESTTIPNSSPGPRNFLPGCIRNIKYFEIVVRPNVN